MPNKSVESVVKSANESVPEQTKEQKLKNLNSVSNKIIRFTLAHKKKTEPTLGILLFVTVALLLALAFSNMCNDKNMTLAAKLIPIPAVILVLFILSSLIPDLFFSRKPMLMKLSACTDIDLSVSLKSLEKLNLSIDNRISYDEEPHPNQSREKDILKSLKLFTDLAITAQINEFKPKGLDYPYAPSCGYGYEDISKEVEKIHAIVDKNDHHKSHDKILESVKLIAKSINQNIKVAKIAHTLEGKVEGKEKNHLNPQTLNHASNAFNSYTKYLTELLKPIKAPASHEIQEGTAKASWNFSFKLPSILGFFSSWRNGSEPKAAESPSTSLSDTKTSAPESSISMGTSI